MILVPHGAEYHAVRRGCSGSAAASSILAVAAGSASVGALEGAAGTNFVILGLCGALDPALHVGDVVACESARLASGESIDFDPAFTAHVAGLTGARNGRALTAERVVGARDARAKLHERHGAHIVEMEGFHLAQRLTSAGCTVAMVRVVSDDAAYDLPDIAGAIGADGRLRPWTLLRAFARAPRNATRFIADARRALARLESTTAKLISH